MTTDTTDDSTFPFDVCGRTILCRYMTDAQMLMTRRVLSQSREILKQLDEDSGRESWDRLNLRVLDVMESLIVNAADVEFVEEQMLLGKVTLAQLRPILSGGRGEGKEPADDEPGRPVKKAARKTVKKTVVKQPVKLARATRVKK